MSETILQAINVTKYFHDPNTVQVLKSINMSVTRGEFVSVIGKSGCGKSTLLYILSTMDTDYEGELVIDNESMKNKKERSLAAVRNEKIGFVFQFHYLLNEFNVLKGFPIEPIFDKMSNLELLSLLLLSKKRLLIDSCLQHAAMALNLPSTVLWIGTSPKLFGYDLHDNIIANPPKNEPKLINSYLFDYNFEGILHESPYMEGEDLFNVENIINSLI